MRPLLFAFLALAVGLSAPSAAHADVPAALSFAGSLSTSAGGLSGPVTLTFSMYADAESLDPAALLWSETLDLVSNDGAFVAMLGADPSNPFPADLLDHPALFLGVQVEDDPEMAPRLGVGSVPYAVRSADAGQLGGQPPSAFAAATHGHAMGEIAGEVPSDQLPPAVVLEGDEASVSGAMLQSGAVSLWHLADMGCAEGEAVAWNDAAGAWACLPFAAATHGHAMGEITGEVPTDQLPAAVVVEGDASSVSGAMLQPGAVKLPQLGDMGCADGGALSWDDGAGSWACKPTWIWSAAGLHTPQSTAIGKTPQAGLALDVAGKARVSTDTSWPAVQGYSTLTLDAATDPVLTLESPGATGYFATNSAKGDVVLGSSAGFKLKTQIAKATGPVASGSSLFAVTGAGWTGIGTDTPAARLDVSGNGTTFNDGFLFLRNKGNDTGLRLYDGDLPKWAFWNDVSLGHKLRINPEGALLGGLTMDQAGWTGLGTDTPTAHLDVYGSGADYREGFLFLRNKGNDAGLRLYDDDKPKWHLWNEVSQGHKLHLNPEGASFGGLSMDQAANTTFSAKVDVTGNLSAARVGVGTTSPSTALDVSGNGSSVEAGTVSIRNVGKDAGLRLYDGSDLRWSIMNTNSGLAIPGGVEGHGALRIQATLPAGYAAEAGGLWLFGRGNVWAGTVPPASVDVLDWPTPSLTVTSKNNAQTLLLDGTDSGAKLVFWRQGAWRWQISDDVASDSLSLGGAGNRMYLTNAGRLGLRTSAPEAALDVKGAGGSWVDGFLFLRNSKNLDEGIRLYAGTAGTDIKWHLFNSVSQGNKLRIAPEGSAVTGGITMDQSGNVSIGTTSVDSGTQLQITGVARKPGGGAWATSSDRRLKKNIHTLTGSLDKLLRLRGVSYEWRNPEDHGNMVGAIMGMIAQEVREVFPEWIGTDDKGFLTLGIIGFEGLTVEAVRELSEHDAALEEANEALHEENEALQGQVEDLRARLEAIEARLR